MVVIESHRWILQRRIIFFPIQDEFQILIQGLTSNSVLRIIQTTVLIPNHLI